MPRNFSVALDIGARHMPFSGVTGEVVSPGGENERPMMPLTNR
jgi:hypothetical protein